MIPERLSPDLFAAAIAARLDTVVPESISVRAEGSVVGVYDPSWWGGSSAADILDEEDGRSIVELVETAAHGILNSTQDVVMESTREQWPLREAGARAADPGARVVGEHLHLWFGDEAAPVLRLQPIDLTEVANGAA
jgi:hypothetical protein